MREIRFRVWDAWNKGMLYPDLHWFWQNGIRQWPQIGASLRYDAMQSTGLQDADGDWICEGDIIAKLDGSEPAIVVWDEGSAAFAFEPIGSADEYADGGYLYELHPHLRRVVGNKFEHPELLQTKENDTDECE
jgi:hypothetical protein